MGKQNFIEETRWVLGEMDDNELGVPAEEEAEDTPAALEFLQNTQTDME